MRKRVTASDQVTIKYDRFMVRLFDIDTACEYLSMGKTRCREWLISIGAVRKFGGRVLYDRNVIDDALDKMEAPEEGAIS